MVTVLQMAILRYRKLERADSVRVIGGKKRGNTNIRPVLIYRFYSL